MMSRAPFRSALIAPLAALALAAGGCAGEPLQTPSAADSDPQLHLRAELEKLVAEGRIPGATVMIARDGLTLTDITEGYRDVEARAPLAEDNIFRLYSMSKPITSVAILMLAEQGKLALDDPAEKYLPEWRGMRVYVSGGLDDMVTVPVERPITIADLLTHTAGITYHFTGTTPVHHYYRKYGVMRDTPVGRTPEDGPPARNLDELVARLGKAPMLHQPAKEFAYSYSTTVLGAVIERASGERLDRFLERHLFDPLGMEDSGFFVADADLPRFTTLYTAGSDGLAVTELPDRSDYRDLSRLLDGGGAIAGTARDYLRFAQMLANGGTLGGTRILSEESAAAMLVPRVRIDGLGQETAWIGYGLALGTAETEREGGLPSGGGSWSGSGNTYFFIDPKRRGVALLMTHFLGGAEVQGDLREIVNRSYYRLAGSV
jgi:CubicO group peptidase (beta-lactamase class C family)